MHQWQQINKKTVAEKIDWTWLSINTVVSVTETITFRYEGQHQMMTIQNNQTDILVHIQ